MQTEKACREARARLVHRDVDVADDVVLSIEAITKRFGGVLALDDVSLIVPSGSIVGLIGPNGSGKTTLLNTISGMVAADRGRARLKGRDILGMAPSRLAAQGISRTFQTSRVFGALSVRQNLLVPLLHHDARDRAIAKQRIVELLSLVELDRHADDLAAELSGGQQKLLEFARALVTRPCVVLLDEPFVGVQPRTKEILMHAVREMSARADVAFLIVSHEVPELIALADLMTCMVQGRVVASGAPSQVVGDARVRAGYLGIA